MIADHLVAWECDNEDDCGDTSDEDHCLDTNNCASDKFCYNDGTCIPASWECDGMDDCTDGEGEPLTCNMIMEVVEEFRDAPPPVKILTPNKQWRT